jgi:hypothetical protein
MEVVKGLLVEMDGNVEKLRKALREGGVELDKFQNRSQQSNQRAGAGVDAFATRQANAARAIAGATETMARQGRIGGEAMKQLVSQGANLAMMFGTGGAITGAIGVTFLAIVNMAARARQELAAMRKEHLEGLNRFEAMDASAQAAEINRLRRGDTYVAEYRDIAAASGPDRQTMMDRRGLGRLQAEERMLTEAAERVKRSSTFTANDRSLFQFFGLSTDIVQTASGNPLIVGLQQVKERLDEIQAAATRANDAIKIRMPILQSTATTEAQAKQSEIARAEEERLRKRFQENPEEWARRMRIALRDGFAGTTEDIKKAFDELEAYARETGRGAEIPLLVNARDRALEAVAAITQMQREMERSELHEFEAEAARTDNLGLTGPHAADLQRLRIERDTLSAMSTDVNRSEVERSRLLKEAMGVQARITDLVGEEGKERARTEASLASQALALGQVLDGVLQMVDAWTGVDAATTNVLRNVVQIGANIPNVMANLKTLQTGKNADGKVVSGSDAMKAFGSSIVPIIGSLVGIGATLFGESPAEQERKRIQRENTRALRDLTAMVGSTGIEISGNALGIAGVNVGAVLGATVKDRGLADAQARRGDRAITSSFAGSQALSDIVDVSSLRDSDRLRWRTLEAQGIDRRALEEAAEALGITLNGTVGSFRALQRAIDEVEGKLGEFGTSFEDRQTIANAEIAARGITDPIEKLVARTAPAQTLSPVVKQILDGRDLSSAEDREEIRKEVLAIIERMKPGGDALSTEELGGLTRDQLLDALLDIVGGLEEIGGEVAAPTSSMGGISGFRGLTEATGNRLSDYTKDIAAHARRAEAQRETTNAILTEQLAIFSGYSRTPLTLPVVPLGGSSSGTRTVSIAMEINLGGITVQVLPGADPVAQGTAVAQQIASQASEIFYNEVNRGLKIAGDVQVTPGVS